MNINWLKLLNNFYLSREKLSETIYNLLKLGYLRNYLVIVLSLNILNWLFVYLLNRNLSQNLVILHYNVNLGVNLIGNASKIYIIPLLGLIFILINFFLLVNIYRQNKFIIHILMSTAILSNILLLTATATIYLINFR